MKRLTLAIGIAWVGCNLFASRAADLTLRVIDKAPPQEIAEPIAKSLEPKATQILDGETPVYEFWFRRDIPLKSKPASVAKSLESVDEITFLGVAAVGKGQRDYKDNEIIPGIYTVRFGLQPQDGDHMGTSDYPYFAVLVPAKADGDVNAIKTYRAMVRASAKATTAGHPAVLSLRPVSEEGTTPALTTPAAEHKAVRLQLPGKVPDATDTSTLLFDLVYEGRYTG